LVVAAFTQLRLARTFVEDLRPPCERRYDTGRLIPIRLPPVVSTLLAHLETPARPPKPCERSLGRLTGFSGRAKLYPAVKKVRPIESARALTPLDELGGLDAKCRGKFSYRAALRFSLVPFNAEHRGCHATAWDPAAVTFAPAPRPCAAG
jgi:hypothetical protein